MEETDGQGSCRRITMSLADVSRHLERCRVYCGDGISSDLIAGLPVVLLLRKNDRVFAHSQAGHASPSSFPPRWLQAQLGSGQAFRIRC